MPFMDLEVRKAVKELLINKRERLTFAEMKERIGIKPRTGKERTLGNFLYEFTELGYLNKNADGTWSTTDSAIPMTERDYRVRIKHSEQIVADGFAGLMHETALIFARHEGNSLGLDSDTPNIAEDSGGDTGTEAKRRLKNDRSISYRTSVLREGRSVPTADVIWAAPDASKIEALAFQNQDLIFDWPYRVQHEEKAMIKWENMLTRSEHMKLFAESHLKDGYPRAHEVLQSFRKVDKGLEVLFAELPSSAYVNQTTALIGDPMHETDPLGGPRRFGSTRILTLLWKPSSMVEVKEPNTQRDEPLRRLASRLNAKLREHTRAIYDLLGELQVIRLGVQNGQPLSGRCQICPTVRIS